MSFSSPLWIHPNRLIVSRCSPLHFILHLKPLQCGHFRSFYILRAPNHITPLRTYYIRWWVDVYVVPIYCMRIYEPVLLISFCSFLYNIHWPSFTSFTSFSVNLVSSALPWKCTFIHLRLIRCSFVIDEIPTTYTTLFKDDQQADTAVHNRPYDSVWSGNTVGRFGTYLLKCITVPFHLCRYRFLLHRNEIDNNSSIGNPGYSDEAVCASE